MPEIRSRHSSLRIAACAFALLLGACFDDHDGVDHGVSVEAINGGIVTTSTTHRREVGIWSGCTGTLIRRSGSSATSSRWVLTGGHCNDYHEYASLPTTTGGASGAIGFFTSTNGSSWGAACATNADCASVSGTICLGGPGGNRCGFATDRAMYLGNFTITGLDDIRLVRLDAPVPSSTATPTEIAATRPATSSTSSITTWGAGCNSNAPGATNQMWFLSTQNNTTGAMLCEGDSGGPRVWGSASARGQIFDVNSCHYCGFSTNGGDGFANAVAYRSLIDATIDEWETWGNAEIRRTGWCTHATARMHWGDVDNDGDPDAICHDTATGYRWVAETNLRLTREMFSTSTPFCAGSGKTLLTGDFGTSASNSTPDGRTDLLCHDTTAGMLQIDYASSSQSARYGAADWSLSTGFCTHSTGRLHAGDFNGDGRTDLLCHDVSTGQMWIDFASSSSPRFTGVGDWDPGAAAHWCSGSNRQLYVGDFDGDGDSDLLCHTTSSGALSLQLSNRTAAPFDGIDDDSMSAWSSGATCSATSACPYEGQRCELGICMERLCVDSGRLTIADVSGDGISDAVCEYPGGRSVGVRAFAGNPMDADNTPLMNNPGWLMVWNGARFGQRTARAASRPWMRW